MTVDVASGRYATTHKGRTAAFVPVPTEA